MGTNKGQQERATAQRDPKNGHLKTKGFSPDPSSTALYSIMADSTKKWPENVVGSYYVDDQCIDCDACRSEAPSNFTRQEDNGYSYVMKQPENELEEQQCKAALEACPVEAIGNT